MYCTKGGARVCAIGGRPYERTYHLDADDGLVLLFFRKILQLHIACFDLLHSDGPFFLIWMRMACAKKSKFAAFLWSQSVILLLSAVMCDGLLCEVARLGSRASSFAGSATITRLSCTNEFNGWVVLGFHGGFVY